MNEILTHPLSGPVVGSFLTIAGGFVVWLLTSCRDRQRIRKEKVSVLLSKIGILESYFSYFSEEVKKGSPQYKVELDHGQLLADVVAIVETYFPEAKSYSAGIIKGINEFTSLGAEVDFGNKKIHCFNEPGMKKCRDETRKLKEFLTTKCKI